MWEVRPRVAANFQFQFARGRGLWRWLVVGCPRLQCGLGNGDEWPAIDDAWRSMHNGGRRDRLIETVSATQFVQFREQAKGGAADSCNAAPSGHSDRNDTRRRSGVVHERVSALSRSIAPTLNARSSIAKGLAMTSIPAANGASPSALLA
jgi:hypothetical protein